MAETDSLSRRILHLAESETLQMARLSRQLRAQGHDVIDLSLGEPDFTTPAYIREAAKQAIDEGYTKYPPVAGFLELREAICHKFRRDNGLHYHVDQIVVSTGAKQSIANVMLVLVNPGDEVLVPAPYWVSYREIIKLAEGHMVVIPSNVETNFKISADDLQRAITPRTKVFCFSSPCNPTGSVYTRQELEALAEVFVRHPHVFIISDEIYEYIRYEGDHFSLAQIPELKERVIVVNGFSKAFAMTGWRLGYIGAPRWIAQACEKMQGQITSGANSIAQRAALVALTSNSSELEQMRAAFARRRSLILSLLNGMAGFRPNNPQGAFYVFPDVSQLLGKSNGSKHLATSDDLCHYLMHEAHVALVTGSAFGDARCVRISYATSESLIAEAMQRIRTAIAPFV